MISCFMKGVDTIGLCISRFLPEKILFYVKKTGIKTRRQILQGHVAPQTHSGKKGPVARRHSKVVNLTIAIHARPGLRIGYKTKSCTKKDAPHRVTCDLANFWLKKRIHLRFTLPLKPGQRRRPLQNLQRNENAWFTSEPTHPTHTLC